MGKTRPIGPKALDRAMNKKKKRTKITTILPAFLFARTQVTSGGQEDPCSPFLISHPSAAVRKNTKTLSVYQSNPLGARSERTRGLCQYKSSRTWRSSGASGRVRDLLPLILFSTWNVHGLDKKTGCCGRTDPKTICSTLVLGLVLCFFFRHTTKKIFKICSSNSKRRS